MQGLIDCPWCSPCSEHDPDEADVRGVMLAERAVIEAAKALAVLREFRFRHMGYDEGRALANLRKKVEALQEVEGG